MKENIYDDNNFFEKYGQMLRSVKGLEGAGEWSELKKLLPDFTDKRVLDLGCGYGWHCIYAAENGAKEVLGCDISKKMLETAASKTFTNKITYTLSAMEDLQFEPECFDVIISSLAFHYIADFIDMSRKIYSWLKFGGDFVFSVEHPVFTANGSQDWWYGDNGEKLHFPVDNYFYEGRRDAVFLGEHVVKYHRTLTTYINSLIVAGFTVKNIIEPQPPLHMLDMDGMKDEMRRPMMLLISAKK